MLPFGPSRRTLGFQTALPRWSTTMKNALYMDSCCANRWNAFILGSLPHSPMLSTC